MAAPSPPAWLAEALDVLERRSVLLRAVVAATCVVGAVLAFVLPDLVPPRPIVGAAVALAAILLGVAVTIAVDAGDATVRGPRHVRAVGGELVGVLPSSVAPAAADDLAASVLAARSGRRLVLGLGPAGRGLDTSGWTDALAVALAARGASVLSVDLAAGPTPGDGVLEVVRDGASLGRTVTFEEDVKLARLGAGRDLDRAFAAAAELPTRLPKDLEVLLLALPPVDDGDVLAVAAALDTVLVLARSDATPRVRLQAAIEAVEGVGTAAQVVLVDDRAAGGRARQPSAWPDLDRDRDAAAATAAGASAAGATAVDDVPTRGVPTDHDDGPADVERTEAEPAVVEPTEAEPAVGEPAVVEHAVGEPAVGEPAVDEPAVGEPAVVENAVDEPAVDERASEEPAAEEPTFDEPAAEEPAVDEPAAEEAAVDEPALDAGAGDRADTAAAVPPGGPSDAPGAAPEPTPDPAPRADPWSGPRSTPRSELGRSPAPPVRVVRDLPTTRRPAPAGPRETEAAAPAVPRDPDLVSGAAAAGLAARLGSTGAPPTAPSAPGPAVEPGPSTDAAVPEDATPVEDAAPVDDAAPVEDATPVDDAAPDVAVDDPDDDEVVDPTDEIPAVRDARLARPDPDDDPLRTTAQLAMLVDQLNERDHAGDERDADGT